ncbi:hypothetical protein HAX54_043596 [Datura stramonium]|uniref:Uncharacterized protein n=1 Tax=Datura stramonium TaxID=4076 RepID=A0ABS8SNU5_DATST|nr:hypothetical protein [Datura stramonium]
MKMRSQGDNQALLEFSELQKLRKESEKKGLKEELVDGPTLGSFSTNFCLCQIARFRPAKLYIQLRAVDIFRFLNDFN